MAEKACRKKFRKSGEMKKAYTLFKGLHSDVNVHL